jgi:hypothetical protein
MAQSMFEKARTDAEQTTKATKKTWRAAAIGAAIPFAIFAAAPGVSAAGADPAEAAPVQTVESEQLPPLPVDPPVDVPDPTALLDLQACLTELQGLIAQLPPPPVEPPVEPPVTPPTGSEQLPVPAPGDPGADPGLPAAPDVGALTEVCKQVVEVVKSLLPPVPPVEPPVDPGLPVDPPAAP